MPKIQELELAKVNGNYCIVTRNKRGNIKLKKDVSHEFISLVIDNFDNKMYESENGTFVFAARKLDKEQCAVLKKRKEEHKALKKLRGEATLRWLQLPLMNLFRMNSDQL